MQLSSDSCISFLYLIEILLINRYMYRYTGGDLFPELTGQNRIR